MKCLQSDSLLSLSELSLLDKTDHSKEEEVEVEIEGAGFERVVVEEGLIARDLCRLLALRRNQIKGEINLTLVERYPRHQLERQLEDHEEVLPIARRSGGVKLLLRRVPDKYHELDEIAASTVWPGDVKRCVTCLESLSSSSLSTSPNGSPFQGIVVEDEISDLVLTPVFTKIWYRVNGRWVQCYLLLLDSRLYMTTQIGQVGEMVRKWRRRAAGSTSSVSREYCALEEEEEDDSRRDGFSDIDLWSPNSDVIKGGDARSFDVYTCLNSRRQLGAPTDYGLVLRPQVSGQEEVAVAALTAKDRLLWLTTMRLAKYGKQLRENYRRFKSKQSEEEYCGGSVMRVCTESVRSRVAMDFTGPVGRLVTDPKEAETIAVSEGKRWPTRTLRRNSNLNRRGGEMHLCQPWYHSGLSRAQATSLVSAQPTDGVFLVRDSRSNQGTYVLTFKCANKVIHMPIQPVMDVVKETVVYSLDSGVTKFYDILQLVEFYQLNAGCLPTRLSHYISRQ